jgi:hypothetical protein
MVKEPDFVPPKESNPSSSIVPKESQPTQIHHQAFVPPKEPQPTQNHHHHPDAKLKTSSRS